MKKFILFGLAAIIAMAVVSCDKSKKKNSEESRSHDYDGVVQDFSAGVSQIQALHRQTVYNVLGVKKFEWRNSEVAFNDTITYENISDLHVTDVNDVFFYVDDAKGPFVQYVNSNVKDGLQIAYPIHDIWIEDNDLSGAEIKLSAEDVLQRLKEWNGVLPTTKTIILRKPVGPYPSNAQWVLGSYNNPVFVDAVTGEITNENPAFNPKK